MIWAHATASGLSRYFWPSGRRGGEGFGIAVTMTIRQPGIERATVEEVVHLAALNLPVLQCNSGPE
jgi:hypothetical protein